MVVVRRGNERARLLLLLLLVEAETVVGPHSPFQKNISLGMGLP